MARRSAIGCDTARSGGSTYRSLRQERYHEISTGGDTVTDVLVRDVPEEVVAALDARAARLGLSRSEYLRRRLAQEAVTSPLPVTVEHLRRFADTFVDLADAEVMKGAWE